MNDIIIYVIGIIAMMIILSPVIIFLLYLSVLIASMLVLFFIYGVIGAPWHILRKLTHSKRSSIHYNL